MAPTLPFNSRYTTIVSGPQKHIADPKAQISKQHRRSRTGCYTCRLRRKKCEEGKPACKACLHLNIQCEYKRPDWWGSSDERRQHKEAIKQAIRLTKQNEKHVTSATSPPSLCHSLPTTDAGSDVFGQTRAVSEESQHSHDFAHALSHDYFAQPYAPYPEVLGSASLYSPYEVDIKTETQTFVNDIPTRRDSTISTFSTFQPLPAHLGAYAPPPADPWMAPATSYWDTPLPTSTRRASFPEEPLDFNFFELPHAPGSPAHQTCIAVDPADQPLLNHFIDHVLRLLFPILDVNQHGLARRDIVLPALESNRTYLHCCLSIAALHLKATERVPADQIDPQIMHHRFETISELCRSLEEDTNHVQILEAALAMIFFASVVGRPDDGLADIPWHQHFQAVTSLVDRLGLPQYVVDLNTNPAGQPPFTMTLTAWIDILGATMRGRAPAFADTYREKLLAQAPMGLAELMGCDDQVLFLLSEVVCLEALARDGMDHETLCSHIRYLGEEISKTEQTDMQVASVYSSTGALRPKQLRRNMTEAYRIALRIYLCSLVPEFDRHQASIVTLTERLCGVLECIPAGAEGFDRSLVWPLLIAGAASTASSPLRTLFADRCGKMGDAATCGSFGRMTAVLRDVWAFNDAAAARGSTESISWRDAMQQRGWDFLLI